METTIISDEERKVIGYMQDLHNEKTYLRRRYLRGAYLTRQPVTTWSSHRRLVRVTQAIAARVNAIDAKINNYPALER